MTNSKTLTEKLEEIKVEEFVLIGTSTAGRVSYTMGKAVDSENKKLRGGLSETVAIDEPRSVTYTTYLGEEYPIFTRRDKELRICKTSIVEVVVGLEEIANYLSNHPSGRYKWHAALLKRVKK